jgi:antitoxin (DNA-binding transcriptional repressor) of toxin-antitoxin stability system
MRTGAAGGQFTVHAAKSRLSRLIDAALAGEEVIIARGSRPAVRLVALPQSGFVFGVLADAVGRAPDFLAPMPEAEIEAWEGRG